ncbi:hypothetical protein FE257_004987 [Aspergillus nanangensis]|uniref:Uncharacterized protein n=1 Tax=Aspergillus nanangensis TaxID=2582783 RepID=A0AAD4CRD9_ASPNN|nr:hypothetical protein FE257_004987 [Aspergillus nanangensis]
MRNRVWMIVVDWKRVVGWPDGCDMETLGKSTRATVIEFSKWEGPKPTWPTLVVASRSGTCSTAACDWRIPLDKVGWIRAWRNHVSSAPSPLLWALQEPGANESGGHFHVLLHGL